MRAALFLLALALAACSADDSASSGDEARQLDQAAASIDINATANVTDPQ